MSETKQCFTLDEVRKVLIEDENLGELATEIIGLIEKYVDLRLRSMVYKPDSQVGFEPTKKGTPIGKMTVAEASKYISALFQGKHVDEVDETKSRFYRPQHRRMQISTNQIQTLQNALKQRNMGFPETVEELKKIIDGLADKKR